MTVLPIRKGPDEAGAAKVVPANQKAIDTLPFASGMWRVEGIPGLYVRCRAKTKSFRLERRIDGVLLKKTLAAETVKQAKAAALTEWTRMKPRPAPAGVTTLHMAVEQYLGGKVPELAPKTVEIARYNLNRHLSRWKDRSLVEIGGDRAGIRTLQQVVTKKHGRSTSNQVIRLLAAVYRWHQDIDQDLPDWPRKAAAIHKIKSRQWAYAPDELRAWWYAARKEKDGSITELGVKTLGPIKRMWWLTALLTGARKGSIEALRWSDVDSDKKVIRFRVTKGDRPYAVPISDTLAELLARYRESGEVPPSEWVFPSPRNDGAHIVNVRNPNEGVRAPHKLRHTFRTVLAELGASTDQARLLMGHSLGGDVSLGYITSSLVVESLRPLANAVARHYVAVIGELS